MERERHVVAIYPHPDDESFGKAGLLALYTQAKVPVTLICGTLGQMGRNMGSPLFATRESLPRIREQELQAACQLLGIEDLRLLGLRDKTLEFEDPDWLAQKILVVLQETKPSLVITYYPEHGVHPDHDAMSKATVIAVNQLPVDERPRIYGSAITRGAEGTLGPPEVTVDVGEVLETKMAAIRAHRSQSAAMLTEAEAKMEADPEFREKYIQRQSTERYWIYPRPESV